jgi:hypothetical protein
VSPTTCLAYLAEPYDEAEHKSETFKMSIRKKRALVATTVAVMVAGAIVAIAATGNTHTYAADRSAADAYLTADSTSLTGSGEGSPTAHRLPG